MHLAPSIPVNNSIPQIKDQAASSSQSNSSMRKRTFPSAIEFLNKHSYQGIKKYVTQAQTAPDIIALINNLRDFYPKAPNNEGNSLCHHYPFLYFALMHYARQPEIIKQLNNQLQKTLIQPTEKETAAIKVTANEAPEYFLSLIDAVEAMPPIHKDNNIALLYSNWIKEEQFFLQPLLIENYYQMDGELYFKGIKTLVATIIEQLKRYQRLPKKIPHKEKHKIIQSIHANIKELLAPEFYADTLAYIEYKTGTKIHREEDETPLLTFLKYKCPQKDLTHLTLLISIFEKIITPPQIKTNHREIKIL